MVGPSGLTICRGLELGTHSLVSGPTLLWPSITLPPMPLNWTDPQLSSPSVAF